MVARYPVAGQRRTALAGYGRSEQKYGARRLATSSTALVAYWSALVHVTYGLAYQTARRLGFIRWLVTTGRLSEGLEEADRLVAGTITRQAHEALAASR